MKLNKPRALDLLVWEDSIEAVYSDVFSVTASTEITALDALQVKLDAAAEELRAYRRVKFGREA